MQMRRGSRSSVAIGETPPPGVIATVTVNYPIASWSDAHLVLVWLWPSLFLAYQRFGRRARLRAALWWFEPLLLYLSAGLLPILAAFQPPAIGYYVAYASLSVYDP